MSSQFAQFPPFLERHNIFFQIENSKFWWSLIKGSQYVFCELWTRVKFELRKLKVGVHSSHSSRHFQRNIMFLFQIENGKFWWSLTKGSQFASCDLWTVNSSQTWVKEIKGWSSQFTQFTPFLEKHNLFISNWKLQVLTISY